MSYFTETYPTSIDVRVTFTHHGEVDSFDDAIKGNDVMHAIERAHENWPGAAVEFLGITDSETIDERAEATNTFGWADAATWSPASEEVITLEDLGEERGFETYDEVSL
jgi:hypothetical protein